MTAIGLNLDTNSIEFVLDVFLTSRCAVVVKFLKNAHGLWLSVVDDHWHNSATCNLQWG